MNQNRIAVAVPQNPAIQRVVQLIDGIAGIEHRDSECESRFPLYPLSDFIGSKAVADPFRYLIRYLFSLIEREYEIPSGTTATTRHMPPLFLCWNY